jgi:hypothetical protein
MVLETTFGTTVTNPDYLRFSDFVQNVAPTGDAQRQSIRDWSDEDVQEFVNGIKKFGLTVEFIVQRATQLEDWIERDTDGRLKSWQVELSINQLGTTKTFLTLNGCKPNSVEVSTEAGDVPFRCKVEFMVKSVTTSATEPTIGTGSREAAIGTTPYTFIGGTLERPSATAFAYITRSVTVTVNHNLGELPDINETAGEYKNFAEGIREVSGSADVAVEDGGKVQFDEAMTGTENDLELYMGTTSGDPYIKVTDVQFPDASFEFSDDEGSVFFSRSWVGKTPSIEAVP